MTGIATADVRISFMNSSRVLERYVHLQQSPLVNSAASNQVPGASAQKAILKSQDVVDRVVEHVSRVSAQVDRTRHAATSLAAYVSHMKDESDAMAEYVAGVKAERKGALIDITV